ncbi:hypothetical protein RIR_e51977_A0A2N1NPC1_9GLOM [Rhizophagus irregularis DAOM 181602=DAOM 197198]|nr:hypothetical protein RIR_e51977_A0A2N1NPC1_9GLOM [Rhizophagus irregularis DAOM 181602=DAOM 197198]
MGFKKNGEVLVKYKEINYKVYTNSDLSFFSNIQGPAKLLSDVENSNEIQKSESTVIREERFKVKEGIEREVFKGVEEDLRVKVIL